MPAPRISSQQWDELAPKIKDLVRRHIPLRCKDGRRKTVSDILKEEHGLDVTVSQLEAKLKEWSVGKNLRLHEWKAIMPRLDELERSGTVFQLSLAGQEIKKSAIQRARRVLRAKESTCEPQVVEPTKGSSRPTCPLLRLSMFLGLFQ